MNKLMSVKDYLEFRFKGRQKPSERTIRRWIATRKLPGKKIGGLYFVDITAEDEIFTLAQPGIDEWLWAAANKHYLVQRCYDYVKNYLDSVPRYTCIPPTYISKNTEILSHE